MSINNTFKYAFNKSLPVMAGYAVLGMGFGILLEAKGYGVIWAFLMSFTIYAGSMQYVSINLLTGGATLISAAIMTVMVNARHVFYGISMIERYKDTEPYKPYLIFALTDETYSLVCNETLPEGIDQKKYYFFVSALNQSYWVAGSVIGSLIGSILGFNTAGIEFSMTALFVVVFVEQWKSVKNHTSALVGVIATTACLLVFGPLNAKFLIPSMILITILLFLFRPYLDKSKEDRKHE
ncbi:MAG: AzlC family ABC transporter permease [Eubacteriales bacterium]|nr:AzlC family ABC transporter permease [Eubacteriales bacterium]